jgi:hypothetical protein
VSQQPTRSARSTAEVIALSRPAERVQAALFTAILNDEVATMAKNLAKAEAEWRSRCGSDGYDDPPERLVLVRQRLAEAVRMLDALHTRFQVPGIASLSLL